ncbi:MAG: tRNA uridine-5-carboxymethylaminomethyl(34) synthesis GTPase MnmE [Gammaproteobacteria bacterium]
MADTIAAIATPPGQGGVGIIRISGENACSIAEKVSQLQSFEARKVHFASFFDDQQNLIDQGLLIYFKNPASFTGEDVVELQTHGSPVVLDMLIEAITQQGARIARPGEFSERAFLNGKLDLTQAEAIADLIEAGSKQAARMATRSLQGSFSQAINELVENLIKLRMFVEAAIDFPEEEIDFLSDSKVTIDLEDIKNRLDTTLQKANQSYLVKEGMNLVIAGKPNAGKSSLLNALSGSETAIVTNIPGTTRDTLKTHIQIDGMPVHIIDTAGLRQSEDIVELEGIKRAKREIAQADHILWVYDSNETLDVTDIQKQHLPDDIPVTYIKNKIDKINIAPSVDKKDHVIAISAKHGTGIDLVKNYLKQIMGYRSEQEGDFLARRRHIEALQRAARHLDNAETALQQLKAGELLAEELRLAQNELNEITGEFTSDDLLGKIFSSFCIGK